MLPCILERILKMVQKPSLFRQLALPSCLLLGSAIPLSQVTAQEIESQEPDWRRTVVFIYSSTQEGQDLA